MTSLKTKNQLYSNMVSCISCKISHVVRGRKDVSFHRIPSNNNLRKAWLKFLKLKESELPRRAHLCSQHFDEIAFDRSSHCRVHLKRDAVPSILVLRKRNDKISTGGVRIKEESYLETQMSPGSDSIVQIKEENDIDISEIKVEDSSDEATVPS